MHRVESSYLQHRELGRVAWLRNYDQALSLAFERNKPIFLLFQEVPGCSTCVGFGEDALSHPLMVEMIEESFIPLAIFNNHQGHDADVLQRFGEPSWNNPVVHFLDSDGADVVLKLSNCYDPLGLYEKIVAVVKIRGTDVPAYFRLLYGDLLIETGGAMVATYETPCFWSGETSLAQNDAVIATDAGWVDGEEAVRVHFDSRRASPDELDAYALQEGFSRSSGAAFRVDDDPQYYLARSRFRYLPLSAAQRTKVNLAIPYKLEPEQLLSPRQMDWLRRCDLESISWPSTYRGEMRREWSSLAIRTATNR